MRKISESFYSFKSYIIFVLTTTLWSMFFAVAYNPTFTYADATLWHEHSAFCTAIIGAIVFGVIATSRLLFMFTRRKRISELEYLVWQVSDMIIVSLFVDLFLCLYFHRGYFELFPTILICTVLILGIPYGFLWLLFKKKGYENELHIAEKIIDDLHHGIDMQNASNISFYDQKGLIKLVTNVNDILYLEAAGNYTNIVYLKGNKQARYALRNTLKAIEKMCESQKDLVRCHRTYFINLRHVKMLRRTDEGLVAEFNFTDINEIPISKTYNKSVVEAFATRE